MVLFLFFFLGFAFEFVGDECAKFGDIGAEIDENIRDDEGVQEISEEFARRTGKMGEEKDDGRQGGKDGDDHGVNKFFPREFFLVEVLDGTDGRFVDDAGHESQKEGPGEVEFFRRGDIGNVARGLGKGGQGGEENH